MARFRLMYLALTACVSLSVTALGRREGFALERREPRALAHHHARSVDLRSADTTSATAATYSISSEGSLSSSGGPYGPYAMAATSTAAPSETGTGSVASAYASGTSATSDLSAYATKGSATAAWSSMAAPMATPSGMSGTAPASANASVDVVVLQLAVVLEAFEGAFYREGLKRFGLQDMMAAGLSQAQALVVIEQLQIFVADEQNHFDALSGALIALGSQVPSGCGFDFGKTMSTPLAFLAAARTIEAVGVSAYLGAARLLQSPDLLQAAASILTLEARHQSLLNVLNGGSYAPQSFDIQLTPQAVLALVGGFLTGCKPSDLGLTANQPLSVSPMDGSNVFKSGEQLKLEVDINIQIEVAFCQVIVGGSPIAQVMPATACYVPSGVDGPLAVYLTKSSTPLATDVVIQNQLTIVAGPDLIFVDERVTVLAALLGPAFNASQEIAPCAAAAVPAASSTAGSITAAAPYSAGSPRGSPYRFARRMRPGRRHA